MASKKNSPRARKPRAPVLEDPDDIEDVSAQSEQFSTATPIEYFGSDFDVHGLVRRLNRGDILIPRFDPQPEEPTGIAGFQRQFVWRKYQMDRFVESLLLGFPVPGIFLVQQEDKKLLVLDGQQRLTTLRLFYSGKTDDDAPFTLESVSDPLQNLSYDNLTEEQRRALDNTFIHAIILKHNPEENSEDAIYQVFERLNTGGTNLYPHEIRVALYGGKLVQLLRDLNQQPAWRKLYGSPSPRLKDQELILRFIALYYESDQYKRPLKAFLNGFVRRHRELNGLDTAQVVKTFAECCDTIERFLGRNAFRTSARVNAALVDSLMFGVASRLETKRPVDSKKMKSALARMMGNEEFINAIGRATADEERVSLRLETARKAFAKV